MSAASTSAPWTTPQRERELQRALRRQRKELRERDPSLWRRLRRLSDDQLRMLEIALLRMMPASAGVDDELRTLERAQQLAQQRRDAERARTRPRGGGIVRLRFNNAHTHDAAPEPSSSSPPSAYAAPRLGWDGSGPSSSPSPPLSSPTTAPTVHRASPQYPTPALPLRAAGAAVRPKSRTNGGVVIPLFGSDAFYPKAFGVDGSSAERYWSGGETPRWPGS